MHYFPIKTATPIAIALALMLGASSHAQNAAGGADEHAAHQHGGHQTADLQLDHGQQWQTDAPLREGMERIRTAVAAAAGHADATGGLDASSGKVLADEIDAGIAFMVTHCRLAPQADANLHILIGQMAEAAALARKPVESRSAMARMRAALDTYPHYFSHPGW
jgi:hypothetical protein